MASVEDLYDAIELDDVDAVHRLLLAHPELVEGPGATPPPIHWAIYHDRTAAAEALLDRGADIERPDQDRDSSPLAYAIVFGRREIVQLLLGRGARTEGMRALARRGAAGAFEQYPDVADPERFDELASILPET